MAPVQGLKIVLVSVTLCFFFLPETFAAKCTGQWAIHACGGGNGKRSDTDSLTSLNESPRDVLMMSSDGEAPFERDPLYEIAAGEERSRDGDQSLANGEDRLMSLLEANQRIRDDFKKRLLWKAMLKRFRMRDEGLR